jgi:hypothetical protein
MSARRRFGSDDEPAPSKDLSKTEAEAEVARLNKEAAAKAAGTSGEKGGIVAQLGGKTIRR